MIRKQVHERVTVIAENIKEHHEYVQTVIHVQSFPHAVEKKKAEEEQK